MLLKRIASAETRTNLSSSALFESFDLPTSKTLALQITIFGLSITGFKFEIKQPYVINNLFWQGLEAMKGTINKKPMFIEIGKSLGRGQPSSKKQTRSYFQGPCVSQNVTPSTAPHVTSTHVSGGQRRKVSLPYPAKISRNGGLTAGMNDEFLFMRKQNHLNTHFNLRKNKLKQITKENKQIYERLNSQKSLYSSIELNKSFQLNQSIKNRLSQSKLSQRSNSSRLSQRSKVSSVKGDRPALKKKDNKIQIKTSSIHHVVDKDLSSFKGLFCINTDKAKYDKDGEKRSFSINSYRKNEIYTRPALKQTNKNTLEPLTDKKISMGGLLHRIQEQMKPRPNEKSAKKASGYIKMTKGFAF